MERKRILLAVRTPRDFQELRTSLLTAGYGLRVVDNGAAALAAAEDFGPHLILSEVELPKVDGLHLLRELKSRSATSLIPFVLISHHRSVEERVHSINFGVDEYITTPFDVKETLLRIEIILKEIEKFEGLPRSSFKGFWGKLVEINLVELLQILEIGKKSAFVKIQSEYDHEGTVFVREGEVVDSFVQDLDGERALFRMFSWSDGTFEVRLRQVSQRRLLKTTTRDLILRGLTLRDRWQRFTRNLPPLKARIKPGPNFDEAQIEEHEKRFLKHIRENARLIDMIEDSNVEDLRALEMVARMFHSGRIMEIEVADEFAESQNFPQFNINGKAQFSKLVANFFSHRKSLSNNRTVERRHEERRQIERRLKNRRHSKAVHEGPNIFLNKTELIMIREKLAAKK